MTRIPRDTFTNETGVHVMVKRTGTMKKNWLSDSFYGGRGIGWTRTSMAGISWSSANDPEFRTM